MPTLLQMALGYLVLVLVFTGGTYATYRLFEGHSFTRFLFWSFVVMVFLGAVLPPVLSGQAVGLGVAIGASTILGTIMARRASK
jgi:hypothetical protein